MHIVPRHNINEYNCNLNIKFTYLEYKDIIELFDNCDVSLEYDYIPEFLRNSNFLEFL